MQINLWLACVEVTGTFASKNFRSGDRKFQGLDLATEQNTNTSMLAECRFFRRFWRWSVGLCTTNITTRTQARKPTCVNDCCDWKSLVGRGSESSIPWNFCSQQRKFHNSVWKWLAYWKWYNLLSVQVGLTPYFNISSGGMSLWLFY